MFGHKYGECIDRHALPGCGFNEKNQRFKELNISAKKLVELKSTESKWFNKESQEERRLMKWVLRR